MSEILFIRHAETEMAGRFCGHSDPELNSRGRTQLTSLTHLLSCEPIDTLVLPGGPGVEGELDAVLEGGRGHRQGAAVGGGQLDGDAQVDGQGQRQALVVVGVVADEIDPTGTGRPPEEWHLRAPCAPRRAARSNGPSTGGYRDGSAHPFDRRAGRGPGKVRAKRRPSGAAGAADALT